MINLDNSINIAVGDLRYLKLSGSNANVNIDIGVFNFTTTGVGSFGANTDTAHTLGRLKFGYIDPLWADVGVIAHYDRFNTTDFALAQDATGNTYLNSANFLYFMANGVNYFGRMYMTGAGEKMFHLITDTILGIGGNLGSEVVKITQSGTDPTILDIDTDYSNLQLHLHGDIYAEDIIISGLTAGRIPYISTAGLLADTANLLWDNAANVMTIGADRLVLDSRGTNNIFVGIDSGKDCGAATYNVGIGDYTLDVGATFTGKYNIAIGYQALLAATTQQYNVAIGYQAGLTATSSSFNVFIGYMAGKNENVGQQVFIGYLAGFAVTSGTNNVAIGYETLRYNQTGAYNTLLGAQSGGVGAGVNNNIIGNTFIGYQSGYSINAGNYNTCLGTYSGYIGGGVSNNVCVGAYAGKYETASSKLFIDSLDRGAEATARTNSLIYGVLNASVTAQWLRINVSRLEITDNNSNLFIGTDAGLNRDAATEYNVGVGAYVMDAGATFVSDANTGVGYSVLSGLTSGKRNSGYGYRAGISATTADGLCAFGYNSLQGITTNSYCSAFGYSSLGVCDAIGNTCLGAYTGAAVSSGSYNTFVGIYAGQLGTTLSNCAFLGAYAGLYETASNKLFIDSLDRTNEATARTNSLIYGIFNATVASQKLYINADLYTPSTGYHYLGACYLRETAANYLLVYGPTQTRMYCDQLLLDKGYSGTPGAAVYQIYNNNGYTLTGTGSYDFYGYYGRHILSGNYAYNATYVGGRYEISLYSNAANAGTIIGVDNITQYVGTTGSLNYMFGGRYSAGNFGTVSEVYGAIFYAGNVYSTGAITVNYGVYSYTRNNAAGTSTIGSSYNFYADHYDAAGTTTTNRFGLKIKEAVGTGTLTNQYGLYIDALIKGATSNYPIYVVDSVSESYLGGHYKIVGARQLRFRDAQIYISSIADGYLDIEADTAIRLNADTNITGNLFLSENYSAQFRDAQLYVNSDADGDLDLHADVAVEVEAPVLVLPVKTDTGDPAGQEGALYVNTFDNKVRVYADGAWKDILAW